MKSKNISMYRLWKLSGVSQSTISDIINAEAKNPTTKTLQRIADALNISINDLFDDSEDKNKKDPESKLSKKDERDIKKDLNKTLEQLENSQDGLMFDGEPMDDETRELLRISLENSMRIAKQSAKKYTPKKYRK
jgi:transcriptional regulator with XRE-family HTH domain